MSSRELDNQVKTLREIQSQIEALQAEAEAIRDSIKAEMIEQGAEVINGSGWRASWKIIESSRLDTAALKKALPDVAARFTIATRTSRFCVN